MKLRSRENYKHYYYGLAFIAVNNSRNTVPVNLRRFKNMLAERFDGNLDEMNKAMGLELVSWNVLGVSPALYLTPRAMPNTDTELYNTYYAFKEKFFDGSQKEQPLVNRYFINPEGYYKTGYLRAQYTQKIENYNAKHKTQYASWDEVKLTRNYPADKKKYTDLYNAVNSKLKQHPNNGLDEFINMLIEKQDPSILKWVSRKISSERKGEQYSGEKAQDIFVSTEDGGRTQEKKVTRLVDNNRELEPEEELRLRNIAINIAKEEFRKVKSVGDAVVNGIYRQAEKAKETTATKMTEEETQSEQEDPPTEKENEE